VQNHGMPERRLIALAALALVFVTLLLTNVLALPDWEHPTGRDYDQAAVLVFAAIVVVAACEAWFAWRQRHPDRPRGRAKD
jgi:peptidoglycan/LPS O-acetylase OafA/YrhL